MITHVGTAQGPRWCPRTLALCKNPGGGTRPSETLSGGGKHHVSVRTSKEVRCKKQTNPGVLFLVSLSFL